MVRKLVITGNLHKPPGALLVFVCIPVKIPGVLELPRVRVRGGPLLPRVGICTFHEANQLLKVKGDLPLTWVTRSFFITRGPQDRHACNNSERECCESQSPASAGDHFLFLARNWQTVWQRPRLRRAQCWRGCAARSTPRPGDRARAWFRRTRKTAFGARHRRHALNGAGIRCVHARWRSRGRWRGIQDGHDVPGIAHFTTRLLVGVGQLSWLCLIGLQHPLGG